MKLVIQRVTKARVSITGKVVGRIEKGLFVLFGAAKGDTPQKALFLADKVAKLRVMADENGKMNLSVKEIKDASLLVVSQFTLYADTSAGNRPSFIQAAEPEIALNLYNLFIERLRSLGIKVETGKFGEYMKIESFLDGPVTIVMEK